jgi:peptide deformylase
MSLRLYGDKGLETPTVDVTEFFKVQSIIDYMFQAMIENDGVGLAAPQVGLRLRLFVFDDRSGFRGHMINPYIIKSNKKLLLHEGCLSFPGLYLDDIRRSKSAIVNGLDVNGRFLSYTVDGFAAQIMQHEVDHLDGRLFIDRSVGQSSKLIEDWKRSL